jgi:hypothetical protein
MQKDSFAKKILPLFFLFVIVNTVILIWQKQLQGIKIDALVVFYANLLLFAISVFGVAVHMKAYNKKNPNLVVRSVMSLMLLKFFVLAATVFIYLFVAGSNRSVYAVFVGMFLYIIYTILEVRIALKMNDQDGSN